MDTILDQSGKNSFCPFDARNMSTIIQRIGEYWDKDSIVGLVRVVVDTNRLVVSALHGDDFVSLMYYFASALILVLSTLHWLGVAVQVDAVTQKFSIFTRYLNI